MWKSFFRKQIYLPQDHGSWVFIFSPLLIGLYAGGHFTQASLYLVIAAIAAFLIRQPITMAVKAYSGRRAPADLPAAWFWILLYGILISLSLAGLLVEGVGYLLILAVPGIPVFAWHLWLVSRRQERRQVNVEVIATGVLSLAAPAAYWVGVGRYDPIGWWLWLLTWTGPASRKQTRNTAAKKVKDKRSEECAGRYRYVNIRTVPSQVTGLGCPAVADPSSQRGSGILARSGVTMVRATMQLLYS